MKQSSIRARLAALCIALVLVAPALGADRSAPPDWAYDAIWYQVFPERFRNGDPRNDPGPRDMAGSWPNDTIGAWRVSPWTSDWYKLQPWERKNGKDFWYNAQLRRYGGDLQGVVDELDYLKSLGVNALYLNPVFESPSMHKYDASMYHHVDNNFGPDPDGDRRIWATESPADPKTWKWTAADRLFLRLVGEAHRRGIKVVIDGVFNHTGQTFWAFRDVRAKGRASAYWNWYDVTREDDPATPASELQYRAWFNVPELPELKDENDSLSDGPRNHVRAIVRRWMDPNGDGNPSDGIDGWRLDAAETVGHTFWKDFRGWVRDVNPNAYLSAEIWWQDWPKNKIFDPEPWLRGDEFDAVMNYRWAVAVERFFLGRKDPVDAAELTRLLADVRAGVRPETSGVMMNLYESHDTDRLGSQVVNPDFHYDHAINVKEDARYQVRAPRPDEWERARLLAAFQFTYIGAPMIYYGSEAGMWGGDDPDERKPMVWADMNYEPEQTMPDQSARRADAVRFDRGMFAWYQKLARLRASSAVLRRGVLETVDAGDERVFAFARILAGERVVAAFNASDTAKTVTLPATHARTRDLLTNRTYREVSGTVTVDLAPWSAAVIR